MKAKCVYGAVMASSIGLCEVTDAGIEIDVPVANHSFEAQELKDENFVLAELTDWTVVAVLGGPFNPSVLYYPDEAPDGENVAFVNDGTLSQKIGPAVGLAVYTLEVAVGLRSDLTKSQRHARGLPDPDFTIQLLLEGEVVASFTGGDQDLTPGSFNTFSIHYTTTLSDAGGNLAILLASNNATQINYDDVRLSYQVIPAPGAIALLGVAGVGFRRRRRRA